MATITTKTVNSGGQTAVHTIVSGTAQAADTIDISGLDNAYPHCFLGIRLFDSGGTEITDGTATGTVAVQVQTANNGHLEDPPTASIDASAPVTIDWAANTTRVVATPTSLAGGVVTWHIVLTFNRA